MRISFCALIAMLAGPAVYCFAAPAFPNGLPDSKNFFPIGVWLQSPASAKAYKSIGINVYVGLWRGPTSEQLATLADAGMYVICDQNSVGLKDKNSKVIVGWMHGDEPDNAQELPGRKGYGPPIPPEKIVEEYRHMKAADPTRPVMLNLGQGVAWDDWYGRGPRGHHPEDYPQYVKGCDIASFDIYPANHGSPAVAGNLWYVARGVERLVNWAGPERDVWCCIETTHIRTEGKKPTPAQVRAEVWMALTHGAKGILYFSHQFKPKFVETGLLADADMAQHVRLIDAEIHRLAPVLNEPTAADAARVESSDPQVPIAALCKRHGQDLYVFAVAMRDTPTRCRIVTTGGQRDFDVEVLREHRQIRAAGGAFEDRFDGYGVHLYRIVSPVAPASSP